MKKRLNITTIKSKLSEVGWHGLYKYEQDYLWDWLENRADYLAQLYPKVKAFQKGPTKCLSCDTVMTHISQANGSHWIPRKNYWSRREEWNIHCCCEYCNAFNKEHHHNELTSYMIKTYGQEQVDKWLQRTYQINPKPSYDVIVDVIAKYEDLLSQYNIGKNEDIK